VESVLEFSQIDADDAVAAQLDQHAAEDQGDGRRRLGLGVDEPGVERKCREPDGEGDEEQPADQGRGRRRQDQVVQGRDVEGSNRRFEIEDENRQQQ
jgi:hypothetical protein